MFKQLIADIVRHLIEQTHTIVQSFNLTDRSPNSNSSFQGVRNKDLLRTAQLLLATATFAIVVFSRILIKSMGFTLPTAPEVSDLSQAGFSFTRTAQAAESKTSSASAVLHLHKGSYWVLQSSKTLAGAKEIVEECSRDNLKANFYQVIIDGQNYFRVLLSNRYENNAEAKNNRELLPERFRAGSWVVDLDEAVVIWK